MTYITLVKTPWSTRAEGLSGDGWVLCFTPGTEFINYPLLGLNLQPYGYQHGTAKPHVQFCMLMRLFNSDHEKKRDTYHTAEVTTHKKIV